MWSGQFVYGPRSPVRTTNPHQTGPGPPHMDGVDQGIPFRETLSLTMFRPGVQVLIDRNECLGELRSRRFRSEYARSPSQAILSTESSGRPPRKLQTGTALPPALTTRREKKLANCLSANGIVRTPPRAVTSPTTATGIQFSDPHSSHRKLQNILA